MLFRLNIASLIFLVVSSFVGCQKEETPPVGPKASGVVVATQAYLDNFGTPPQGKAGKAFARVGYLPVRQSPGKVRAFPLFLFNDKDEIQQILKRLVSDDLKFPEESGFFKPFPDDFTLVSSTFEDATETLFLTAQQSWPASDMEAAGLAIAQTVLQFDQVQRVVMMLNGHPFPQMPADGYQDAPEKIDAVEPPTLVLIAGMWEKEAASLDELLVEFDRPVTVNNFKLYDNSGNEVEGEYYTSIFQMAVVILPDVPTLYKEATLLRAEWNIVDGLGRSNSGSTTMPLRRYEH